MRTGKVYLNQRCTKWICFVNGQKQTIKFIYEGVEHVRTIQFFEMRTSAVYITFSFNAMKISIPYFESQIVNITNYFN